VANAPADPFSNWLIIFGSGATRAKEIPLGGSTERLRKTFSQFLRASTYEFAREALDESYEKLESVLASILKGQVKSSGNKKPLSAEKTAHILTSAVRGFKLVAQSATELRKLIQDLLGFILAG